MDQDLDYLKRKERGNRALGVVGTVLGGAALLGLAGNNGCGCNNGGFLGLGNLFGGNRCGCGCNNGAGVAAAEAAAIMNSHPCVANGLNGPTAWEAWRQECQDNLDLTRYILSEKYNVREVDTQEKFALNQRIDNVAARVAVLETAKPYEAEIANLRMKLLEKDVVAGDIASINYTDRKTCHCIYGVTTLPDAPTVTGYPSQCPCAGRSLL